MSDSLGQRVTTGKPRRATPILATTRLSNDLDRIVQAAGGRRANPKWHKQSLRERDGLPTGGGVYCFTLPETALPVDRTIFLYGRTFGRKDSKRQLRIRFEYQASKFGVDADLVVYVGKAANLKQRIAGHLSVNPSATTNQVLRGLTGNRNGQRRRALENARETLLRHGAVHYFNHAHHNETKALDGRKHVGELWVAERDLLEIKLIAKYAPPFNIKAER